MWPVGNFNDIGKAMKRSKNEYFNIVGSTYSMTHRSYTNFGSKIEIIADTIV